MSLPISCPIPISDYPQIVLAHGGGGSLTQTLIDQLFRPAFDNALLNAQHDSAVIEIDQHRLAFTTDTFVVKPWQFPGGDIGSLAINGTINDIAMSGATPQYLSVALILEEGFSMSTLWDIVRSMATAAANSGVTVVTGDTKVVDKGSGDGIFINTSGIGAVPDGVNIHPQRIQSGDVIILSGDIGRHGMAIMAAREDLAFSPPVQSDTCALHRSVSNVIKAGIDIHCLRDATRGGVATTLIELAESSGICMEIVESLIPVQANVRGAAEVLGLDPLYIANEGRYLLVVSAHEEQRTLEVLKSDSQTSNACTIGTVQKTSNSRLSLQTTLGTRRPLDRLSGEQLPRIC